MTVKQLIEQLQQLPPDLNLFTKGYEGGLCDAELNTQIEDVALNYHEYWYYGPHELKSLVSEDDKYQTVKGIIFKRTDTIQNIKQNNQTDIDPYLQTR